MTRLGWHRAPPGTSSWLASQLEPRRNEHPEVFAVAEPLYQWAQMASDPAVPHSLMEKAFATQRARLGTNPEARGVAGPAGA
eukprot:8536849-Pyramimonas_sp.AAC.1